MLSSGVHATLIVSLSAAGFQPIDTATKHRRSCAVEKINGLQAVDQCF